MEQEERPSPHSTCGGEAGDEYGEERARTACSVTGLSHNELRGWTARRLVAEDARWVADIVFSSRHAGECLAYPALLLGHHFVRIAFEGARAVRSVNPHVGWPPFADLLKEQFADITQRARHVSKLLDDNRKGYEEVLSDLHDVYEHNHRTLTGNAPRFLRWLETDLGVYAMGDSVVGSSIPMAYRLGLDPSRSTVISGESVRAVSEEWGSTMAVLMVTALEQPIEGGVLTLGGCGVSYRDRLTTRYLASRYEPEFPIELKLLLLMIEGDLNTNRLYLPLTQAGHEMPVFRARVVTLYHSLTSVQRVLDRYLQLDTVGTRRLRGLLADGPTRRILSSGGRQVRNRCVHYQMDDPAIRPNLTLPMFGLVEAVCPGTTWEEFNEDVADVSDRLSEALSGWRSKQSAL